MATLSVKDVLKYLDLVSETKELNNDVHQEPKLTATPVKFDTSVSSTMR